MGREVLQVLRVSGEEHESAKASRTNGIAFGDSFGGVAYGIKRIGVVAHFLRKTRHFGNATSIVCDRAKSIKCYDHASKSEHGGDCYGDAEETSEIIGDQDARDDDERWHSRCFHRD